MVLAVVLLGVDSKFMILLEVDTTQIIMQKKNKNEIKSKPMSSFIVSPDVPIIYQYPVLPTGCEATSLTYDSHGNGAMVLTWHLLLFVFLAVALDMVCLTGKCRLSFYLLR